MKTIEHTDVDTFEKTEQQFDDFHYELAENVKEFVRDKYQIDLKVAEIFSTNVLSNKEGTKLIIGVIKNRNANENIAEKYKISIEKLIEV